MSINSISLNIGYNGVFVRILRQRINIYRWNYTNFSLNIRRHFYYTYIKQNKKCRNLCTENKNGFSLNTECVISTDQEETSHVKEKNKVKENEKKKEKEELEREKENMTVENHTFIGEEKNVFNKTVSRCIHQNVDKHIISSKLEYKGKEMSCVHRNHYGTKILKLLFRLTDKRKRDVEKIKKIIQYICKNVNNYNLKELTNILRCLCYFGVVLKNDDLYILLQRIKIVSFNKHNIHDLILNLLRLPIPKEHLNKQLVFDLNNFVNNLIIRVLDYNSSISYGDYIFFVKDLQMYFQNNVLSSWLNKTYIDSSILNFVDYFQCSLLKNERNAFVYGRREFCFSILEKQEHDIQQLVTEHIIDFNFVNQVFDMLNELNCKVSNLQIYNCFVPLYIEDFNLIIECISEKNMFLNSSHILPYVLQRYLLFKNQNYKVLVLNKSLFPQKEEKKIIFLKNALYDVLK